jgi:16S rRNA (uracil1498-N3)-methyltransferase
MSDTRVFLDLPLSEGACVDVPEAAFRHLVQVLRMQPGDPLTVFDGRGGEYPAQIEAVAKRGASLRLGAFCPVDRESPLALVLVQGISKGDRMDYTLQKAVELGVSAIVPVVTERCNVHLDRDRQDKKLDHWRGVVVSACEQSGRTRVPPLHPAQSLPAWLGAAGQPGGYVLDPLAPAELAAVIGSGIDCAAPIHLLIGPEGGLSEREIGLAEAAGLRRVRLGPRVLRTETAGMVALTVLQARLGDLSKGATP